MTAALYVIDNSVSGWPIALVIAAIAVIVLGLTVFAALDEDLGFGIAGFGLALLIIGGIAGFVASSNTVERGQQECIARGGRVVELHRDYLCEVTP